MIQFNSKTSQNGGALLATITMIALILVVVQGTMYYTSHSSSKFSSLEKTKLQALQIAEAGIDMNISDIGTSKIQLHENLLDFVSYNNENIGNGSFTTKITTISHSDSNYVISVSSTGTVDGVRKNILVKMYIVKVISNVINTKLGIHSDTSITYRIRRGNDSGNSKIIENKIHTPNSSEKCENSSNNEDHKISICHIPPGNPSNVHTIIVDSSSLGAHLEHGDVIGACSKTGNENIDTVLVVTNTVKLDSIVVSDTTMKSKIISWKE